MRRSLAAALAAGSLLLAPTVAAGAPVQASAAACQRASIEGQSKCIGRGQFCKRSAQAMRDYRKYGLSCTKRDKNGRYHLE
jgi:hypothetical protein